MALLLLRVMSFFLFFKFSIQTDISYHHPPHLSLITLQVLDTDLSKFMTHCRKHHLCILAWIVGSGPPTKGCLHISSVAFLSDILSRRFSSLLTSHKRTGWSLEGWLQAFVEEISIDIFTMSDHFWTLREDILKSFIFLSFLSWSCALYKAQKAGKNPIYCYMYQRLMMGSWSVWSYL